MSIDVSRASLIAEARRAIDTGRERGITLRLIGGLAAYLHCPSAACRGLARDYADIDYVGYARQGIGIRCLFEELGYVGNERFNTMHGRTRLKFAHPQSSVDTDVFLNIFHMCHRLDLSSRLELEDYTLSLADLLLTKLQVIQLNEKDLKDILSLLLDHSLGDGVAPEMIDVGIIASLCGDDWPWYHTTLNTISKVLELTGNHLEGEAKMDVRAKLLYLRQRIENEPKTLKWKIRAKIGEKVRWYDLPE